MKLIDKPLTEMQKRFAELYVYEKGVLSNYEVAIAAGYGQKSAYQRAYELLNPDICPHVVRYIEKLKSEMNEKYRCDFETHKKELWQLREMAKKKNNVQTAVRAEELRAKAAGLHVDKIFTATKNMNSLENLSLEELEERLQNINKLYGNVLGDKGDKEDDIK